MRASIRCVATLGWLFIFCLAHADEIPSTSVTQSSEMLTRDAKPVAGIEKWYVGGTVGLGGIKGEDMTAVNNYYSSLGYTDRCDCFNGEIGNGLSTFLGYKQQDHMDIEAGYFTFNSYHKIRYLNYAAGSQITTKRTFTADGLSLSALFRPKASGYGHGLFFKLGAHISRLEITKDPLTGYNVSQATLNTIGAGDNMAGDGVSWGVGPLISLGFDFRTGKVGAVRLEVDRYFRLGGTSYGVGSLNLGYLANF